MSDFRAKLREELMAEQQTRAALVREKMIFVIDALGAGTLAQGWREVPALLYLVPLIAISFDLYIAGEDFGVKRAAAFLAGKASPTSETEAAWEAFVEANRDPFSRIANPLVSLLSLAGAAAVLGPTASVGWSFPVWLAGCVAAIAVLWVSSHLQNRRIFRRLPAAKAAR